MLAHQVIEELKCFPYIKKEDRTSIINVIKKSHKFHFGSSSEVIKPFQKWVGKKRVFVDDAEYLRLPYEIMWFDYMGNDGGHTIKRGILINTIDAHKFEYLSFFACDKTKWILDYHLVQVTINKNLSLLENNIETALIYSSPLNTSTHDLKYLSSTLSIIQSSLLLLNCKNITTETHNPDEALNKARRKRGRQELFTYKILKLVLPAEKQGKHYKGEPTGEHNRIHFCRGHFKEYTADAPLFGKIVGLWWWQPHVRGRSRDGIVIKDYEINND